MKKKGCFQLGLLKVKNGLQFAADAEKKNDEVVANSSVYIEHTHTKKKTLQATQHHA